MNIKEVHAFAALLVLCYVSQQEHFIFLSQNEQKKDKKEQ